MANLIITVISIALVAVAALMGAYYGGSAFMDGQAKATANTVVAQAEQLAAAWTLQASSNGGDWYPNGNYLLSDLVPDYLSSFPEFPKSILRDGLQSGDEWEKTNLSGNIPDGIVTLLAHNEASVKVCNLIAKMAGGPNARPENKNNTDGTYAPPAGHKFDCIFFANDSSGNGNINSTEPDADDNILIVYRVR